MGWHIQEVDNTVIVPEAAVADLKQITGIDVFWIYDEEDSIVDDKGHLYFDDNAMEHMDYVWNPEVLEVLLKHKVNGTITFCSHDGDNKGKAWGYLFNDGVVTHLAGNTKTMKLKPV